MINPNKILTCKNVFMLTEIKYQGQNIEELTLTNDVFNFNGYSDNIIVQNKYGKELRNKRLQIGKQYKVYVQYSIMLQSHRIKFLKEI